MFSIPVILVGSISVRSKGVCKVKPNDAFMSIGLNDQMINYQKILKR